MFGRKNGTGGAAVAEKPLTTSGFIELQQKGLSLKRRLSSVLSVWGATSGDQLAGTELTIFNDDRVLIADDRLQRIFKVYIKDGGEEVDPYLGERGLTCVLKLVRTECSIFKAGEWVRYVERLEQEARTEEYKAIEQAEAKRLDVVRPFFTRIDDAELFA